ncbi:MAG: hypothetical protein J5798_05605 [Spirochaetaceae bacterium]|nr:hypothetical protein [Spirochaetaceae bacterium]
MRRINYTENVSLEYLKYFSSKDLNDIQDKWDIIRDIYTELYIFPSDVKKIITADFSKLMKWYFEWINLIKRNKDVEKGLIKRIDGSNSKLLIFDYSQYYSNIIKFFFENTSSLDLYSCCYCEIEPVTNYKKKNGANRITLDLDHFFPKDQCPILALSLRNLVPACSACNSRIKNRNNFLRFYGINKQSQNEQMKILLQISPTCDQYEFNKNAKIYVLPKVGFSTKIGYLKNIDSYQINFSANEIYEHEIKAFRLNQRYNSTSILAEALSIMDLKRNYPSSKIQEMTKQFKGIISSEHLEEIIFRRNFDENRHCNLLKLKKDLLD